MIKLGISFLCLLGIGGGVLFSVKVPPSKEDAICRALREIPQNEKWFLEYFFRNLLLREGGACVLSGSKSAVESSFLCPQYYQSTIHWMGYNNSTLVKKGYEIWKKYQHLFPSSNYFFCDGGGWGNEGMDVFLINKKSFTRVIAKSIEDFKNVLGPNITPEEILDRIINGRKYLCEVINHHQALLGILFGYGRHNAWLFHRRDVLEYEFIPKRLDLFEKEIEQINEKLRVKSCKRRDYRRDYLTFSSLPTYASDPTHPETRELHAGYRQQRKKFTHLYKHGNFLEVTLRRITS
jgi:hypothetical protein